MMKHVVLMICCALASAACGSGSGKPDGGGASELGVNASVPQTCQTCLMTSTSNECSEKGKICTSDPVCLALNKCVNACANINAACIANCGDAASQDAIDEWNSWSTCTCGTCASQCNQTFCNIGNGSGTCVADNSECSTTEACCTRCITFDDTCGCIPSGEGPCGSDSDCCSNSCEPGNNGGCD